MTINPKTRATVRGLLHNIPVLERIAVYISRALINHQENKFTAIYSDWINSQSMSDGDRQAQSEVATRLQYRPLISIVTPTYNTPHDYFDEMVQSVLDQTYDNWELVLVDDASTDITLRELIKTYSENEPRIRYKFLDNNLHIAGATNEAIKMAVGDFISLFDHDDILQPNALFEITKALNDNNSLDFIYTDEDKIFSSTHDRREPFFKPDWNRDFLYSVNYITHLTTIRKSVIERVGYERDVYNGAQDWELFLRATRSMSVEKIFHIPKVLYSWRVHDSSTAKNLEAKPYVFKAQKLAIESDLAEHGLKNYTLTQDDNYSGQWELEFKPKALPKVSIILSPEIAKQAQSQIQKHTSYQDYEILISAPNTNAADLIDRTEGEYLVFVDKKLRIHDTDWIEVMLGDAEREDIGFVLAELRKEEDIMKLVGNLLDESVVELVASMSYGNVAKHLYSTVRYNLKTVHSGVAMVSSIIYRQALEKESDKVSLEDIGNLITRNGYRNLYNPYVKVLK